MRRRLLHPLVLFVVCTGLISACADKGERGPDSERHVVPLTAQLALVGGVVHTLDPARPSATAVAIFDGQIVAVGSDEEVSAHIGKGTQVIALEGRTVLPGLTDGHMHLLGLGSKAFGIDLVGTNSLAEVREKVRLAVRRAKPGEWIRGRGWDQNDWNDRRRRKGSFPTARDLDDIAPNNPVVLRRIDGHALWANGAAMKAAGIDRKTSTPKGGRILLERRRPSGVFIDNAMSLVASQVPPLTKEEMKRAYLLGQQACLESGLTQVHDMGVSAAELSVLRELDAAGELSLRVYAMLDGETEDLDALMGKGPQMAQPNQRLTVRGVKFFADGALGSRGAALFEPYEDDPTNKGLLVSEPDWLEARIRSAKERGYQVTVHAIGDRANSMILDIYGRVFRGDARRHRPRIEHAQVVALDDITRFGRLGVIPSMQPTHATSDMPWAEDRLGPGRIKGAYAWQRMHAASATIAAGSDAPVESISPIAGLYAAITRQDANGKPPGGWYPDQALKPIEAIAAFTSGNAWASFRENEAGQIRESAIADLTVLSVDPVSAPATELLGAKAELTIIGGRIAFKIPGADRPPPPPATSTSTPTATSTSSAG